MADKLQEIYESLQEMMASSLGVNRRVLDHSTAKGNGAELKWEEFFKNHLPQRYRVASGFVIDRESRVSDQIDLIIYDRQYCPHLYNQNKQIYLPVESVYAVIEVKQDLDKETIEYAGRKAASVRCLERTSAPITHAGGQYDARPPFRILAGIVALKSNWKPALGETLRNVLAELPEAHRVDFGCVAADGGFEAGYLEGGKVKPTVSVSSKEHSLIFFLFSMLNRLQNLGTVPAIDFQAYLKTVTHTTS